jgi:hypothetical protein
MDEARRVARSRCRPPIFTRGLLPLLLPSNPFRQFMESDRPDSGG